jgi:hypothetical protein
MAVRAEALSRKRRASCTCDLELAGLEASFDKLSETSEPRELFELLRRHGIRFRGASIERIFSERPESPIGVVSDVPTAFMCKAAWFMDRDPSSHVLLEMEAGVAVGDIDLMGDVDARRRAEVTKTLYPEYGFAWVAALSISKTSDGALALYLYGGASEDGRPMDEPLTDVELLRLERMCQPIAEAVERMGLPRGCRSRSLRKYLDEHGRSVKPLIGATWAFG